jgi:hypothetical protein
MTLPPKTREEWLAFHEKLKLALHGSDRCIRAAGITGDWDSAHPWNYGFCNVLALALQEWIHDAANVQQWMLVEVYGRNARDVSKGHYGHRKVYHHTVISYGDVFFDAVTISFDRREFMEKALDFYGYTHGGQRRRFTLTRVSTRHHRWMEEHFGRPRSWPHLQALASELNLAVGRWPGGRAPKLPRTVYDPTPDEPYDAAAGGDPKKKLEGAP